MDKENKKTDIRRARRFANTFRFIDDFTFLNDGGEFKRSFRQIYPAKLELQKENDINKEGSFLDLGIKVREDAFSMCLYDFLYSVVRRHLEQKI